VLLSLGGLVSGCGAAASPTAPARASSPPAVGGEASPAASGDEPEPSDDAAEAAAEDEASPPASVGDSLSVLGDNRPRGELPRARIESGLASSRAALGGCISRASARGGESEGRVVVTFVIEPDGEVGAAAYLVSTLVDDELAECILDVFRELRFDRPRGGIVMVSHPFQFVIERGGTRRGS
jgi:outer membrane biosynthesis protein TonB